MTDIRPIRSNEAETFLRLMCDVFGLDSGRARDVFFSEPLFDLNRKWALFEGPEMVSILTTSPLIFGWGRAFGIAGVATRHDRQRKGCATKLLEEVIRQSEQLGESGALLFARDLRFYEKNGFEQLDRVIRAPLTTTDDDAPTDCFEFEEVEALYAAWSQAHPDRLRRDEQRWNYWRWHYRICTPFQEGYICFEPHVLREPLYARPVNRLPLPAGTEWFGTCHMAEQLQIPFTNPELELYLVGYNVPGTPQMFMTDQF